MAFIDKKNVCRLPPEDYRAYVDMVLKAVPGALQQMHRDNQYHTSGTVKGEYGKEDVRVSYTLMLADDGIMIEIGPVNIGEKK